MLRLLPRRHRDVGYFLNDPARELDGVRRGGPGRFVVGAGDATRHHDVEGVLRGTSKSEVIGYDLIVAAPRPVSILLATGTDDVQRTLVLAHQEAVKLALSYLEDRAIVVRERIRGEDREVSAPLDAAVAFTHGVNRAGEPHLHDHVLLGSTSRTVGRAFDRRVLTAHLPTADALYVAHLRHIMTTSGTPIWRTFDGHIRVVGVDEGMLGLWPGGRGMRGAREAKTDWTRDAIIEKWSSRLSDLIPIHTHVVPERGRLVDEHSLGATLESRRIITRRHLVEAWAHGATFGAPMEELATLIATYYPALEQDRGLSERSVSRSVAIPWGLIRESGARPLDLDAARLWVHRSRNRDERSRSR